MTGRDPRFAELDALLANDPEIQRFRLEKLLKKPFVLGKKRARTWTKDAWINRRRMYVEETGRAEVNRVR